MVKVTYYMSQKQIDTLKEISIIKSLSVGALIRLAVNDFIKKEDN